MAEAKLFEAALGIEAPWYVRDVAFDDAKARTLTIAVDFTPGTRFAVPGVLGEHPVRDTTIERYRHVNFFRHECFLEVRVPRVKGSDGSVRQVEPAFVGKLAGFTLLFEALILAFCREMPFCAVARLTGVSLYRVMSLCERTVDLAVAQQDLSEVQELTIDETSKARGHDDVTIAADASRRAVIEERDAKAVDRLTQEIRAHGGDPEAVTSIPIDMSPSFIKGVTRSCPNAQVTFDTFPVMAHASQALDLTRRAEQKTDPALKGLRWTLLKDSRALSATARDDLEALMREVTTKRTARAWVYREPLREIRNRKQVNVVRLMLKPWCTNVSRSQVQPMKAVARLVRSHLEGICAWAPTRATNGFLKALNGLFQAAKRKARGYGRLSTIRTVIFLIAGKLDFSQINPHMAGQPT